MKFKKYIYEVSMKKGTIIKPPKYIEEDKYKQYIILEDGLKFIFSCFYFRIADIWEVAFEDEEARRYTITKRKGAALELFAALEKVFKQFIEKTLPNKFRFTADIEEKSRVKLYDLLAKKIEKMGMGYKYTKKQSSSSTIYNFKHWSIK